MPPPLVALCYGTRPQVIKASALRREFAPACQVLAVDTGQHYDHVLNGLLYQQLGVDPPDLFLEVGSGSHAEQTAAIMLRTAALLEERKPAAAVVIGDTNSTLGCALAAAKLRVPVVHVEAGLRADDAHLAEEINRRTVDAFAALLCTPGRTATGRLRRERPEATVVETGDVAFDVLLRCQDRLPDPRDVLATATPPYIFATLHRAELTNDPSVLGLALDALGALDLPVVLALHPRTRAALDAAGIREEKMGHSLHLTPAVGYLESLALVQGADVVVTDSGGLQREAYWMGTPCVTLREESEWVETVELGANCVVDPGVADRALGPAVRAQQERWRDGATWDRHQYGRGDAARRIAGAVVEWIASREGGPMGRPS